MKVIGAKLHAVRASIDRQVVEQLKMFIVPVDE
jgi:hypothetical protein